MRHRKKGRKLNRTASHRKALVRNLANQLFEHKEIRTTTAKAKEARSTIERLITYAKKGDLHHRRLAFSFLRQKAAIKMLFDEIAPTYSDRQGGYTRILKLGRRLGDGAQMSLLQLVGFETLGETVKSDKKKKTRKRADKAPAAEEQTVADTKPEKSTESDQKTEKDNTAEESTVQKEQPSGKAAEDKKEAAEEEETKKTGAKSEQQPGETALDTDEKNAEQPEPEEQKETDPDKDKS
jgi:large subunit ribosomal protein L17